VVRLRLEAEALRLELRALAAAFEAARRGGRAG
jgi:hypothetical protein